MDVLSVAWNPSGRQIATASGRLVSIWSSDGSLLGQWSEHETSVMSVAWNPQGNRVVSVEVAGKVVCRDALGGQPLWVNVGLPSGHSCTFTAAGELVHCDPKTMEQELVYLVEQEDGRIEPLKPSEFLKRVK
jgi:WD40 repeat protein